MKAVSRLLGVRYRQGEGFVGRMHYFKRGALADDQFVPDLLQKLKQVCLIRVVEANIGLTLDDGIVVS
jgi:hypothetical protein